MSRPLLQRNTRYLLKWLPVVLLVCSVAFYVLLHMQANHMQEKQLLLKQRNVWSAFTEKGRTVEKHMLGEYDIDELGDTILSMPGHACDTALYYADEQKTLPFQALSANYSWNNKNYRITTYVSSTEILHLIIKVFIAEFIILILLLLAIVFLSGKSSRFLWRPFFASVNRLKQYDIKKNFEIALPGDTGTTEFDQLNNTATMLIKNSNAAYRQQKEFVENASHEIQTPLAIIRTKIELLISEPNLTERQASLLSDISDANERLSQMNRTLLLLAKIENNQFPETLPVDIAVILNGVMDTFRNYYEDFPAMQREIENKVIVNANPSLIEIMVSNLVNNAVVHNIAGGKITIDLSQKQFKITNTGNPINLRPEELFDRFRKGDHNTKTTGLGLAIVSQICQLYHYPISYQYENGLHIIIVTFA